MTTEDEDVSYSSSTMTDSEPEPEKDNNPICKCGGGVYLGVIRLVKMFANHKEIDCIIKPKKVHFSYISPSYFNILKVLEILISQVNTAYEDKVLNVLKLWESCGKIFSSDPCDGPHVFMHYAIGESAILILNPKWANIPKKIKHDYCSAIGKILQIFQATKCHLDAIKYCHYFVSFIKEPWSHNFLPKLLFGNPSQDEAINYFYFEKSNILIMRLKLLCENNCVNEILKLSGLIVDLYNFEFKRKSHFNENDFQVIRDMYYVYLEMTNNKKELISSLKKLDPLKDGKTLMERYCIIIQSLSTSKPEERERNYKSTVIVCEMTACIVIDTFLRYNHNFLPTDFTFLMDKWCLIMMILMESDLKPDRSNLFIKNIIRKFIISASTSNHLYQLYDVLSNNFGAKLPRTLYIEIYIKALSTNINEKERCRHMNNKDAIYKSLSTLVQGYLKLANLLEDIVSVCRECVLTAYSLMPSADLMVRVEYLAIKSGKLIPENSCDQLKNEPATNLTPVSSVKSGNKHSKDLKNEEEPKLFFSTGEVNYFKIHSDLKNLPEPLSPTMHDNLIAVLKYPRNGTFNWNLEWSRIKILCQQYFDDLDGVMARNTLQRKDLKYININIDEYNKNAKINLQKLIDNKDYFSSDNASEDEQSVVSNMSSGDIVSYTRTKPKPKSKPQKRRFGLRRRKVRSRKQTKRKNLKSQKSFMVTENSDDELLTNNKNQSSNNDDEQMSVDSNLEENSKNINSNSNEISKQHQQIKREKRIINKNQHKDFDYTWCPKKVKSNNSIITSEKDDTELLNVSDKEQNKSKKYLIGKIDDELSHPTKEHLNMLSKRLPQLSSLDFIRPAITDHIVNVVQIQTTSNTLTNVSQTQTEHVSNRHPNNEIEKKTNDNQTNTHSLDNFVSVYQSNSLNNSVNSIQNSEIHQGECSFTGSVSVSNQRITTDSNVNVHNIGLQETHDVLLNQNQVNLDHPCYDNQSQNSREQLQPTSDNTVHLSSNVIVRTSDIVNPSHLTQITGQLSTSNATKKTAAYCIKTRDRLDLSLPATISSISANINRPTSVTNTNKFNLDSKIYQNSPVQTSVGLQVNFNNQQSESIQNMISPNNQHSQICTNISESSSSTIMPVLNDQIISSLNNKINTSVNTSFTKEKNVFDNSKSTMSIVNPVSSIQTQTCIDLRPSNELTNPNASIISLMIDSTQSQVIKNNAFNSLYTSPQNQRLQLTDLTLTSQTNLSDEQKKIDNLKLMSQTFTATSEAIKFVTSSTESQRLIQSTDKNSVANLSIFQNTTESLTNTSQENDINSKQSNRGRGNMRTYESKTRALKQANMSDMFVFEKGTLYAVQDDVIQVEPTKTIISQRNNASTNIKIQNKHIKDSLEKPKPSNASPNVTITGSMLPRFQQVFGKTKFQSTAINDTSLLCSTSATSNHSSNPVSVVNRPNISRIYSSSKGVQTNNDVDSIISNTINCIPQKVAENKLQHNVNITKASNVIAIGNNKNNVIMTCKTISSVKNITQTSASSNNQHLASNVNTNNSIKKEITTVPISKIPTTFTTNCNNLSVASPSSNLIYSIPIQNDLKVNNIDNSSRGITQIQRQLKVSPSIIQTVLRKHPNWQQNCFRQGKQNTEVQTSSTVERLITENASNIVKTTIDSSNNKILVNTGKPNVTETNVSSSMMEQVREFESVLEEVRKTSLMNEMSTAGMLPQINHEIIQIHSPTENVDLLNTDSNQTIFPLNKKSNINNERDRCSFSFLNQTLSNDLSSEEKDSIIIPSTILTVRSATPTPPVSSPNHVSVNTADGVTQCPKQIVNKAKPIIKTPASSPSTSAVKVPVLQKPLPKLQEDEQTTQRIYAILDKYAEQLRNSPELKNKPAPRRRTNPPTNPSVNAKRKKSNQLNLKTCSQQTSCSSSGMEMSPTSDMHAIDSEDSSNAVSHFSNIMNSPSRNLDDHTTTTTVISEIPLAENAFINVNDAIRKLNAEVEKNKASQSTQIVVSGTSGSFLSIPEGSTGNVRLLVASGKNQKMYRLHCPVAGPGPVLFQQITTKDSCSNDIKKSSNLLGQNINESAILSTITTNDLQVVNTSLGNEILLNPSQNLKVFEHKKNKPDIILESMEKAQVLDCNEKPLSFPVLKKSQASQSTFSVIHTLPCNQHIPTTNNKIELLSEAQKIIKENIKNQYSDKEQNYLNKNQEPINKSTIDQVMLKHEKSSQSIPFQVMEIPTFHSQGVKHEKNINLSSLHNKNNQQIITNVDNLKASKMSIDLLSGNKVSNDPNNRMKSEDNTTVKQESLNITTENSSNNLDILIPKNNEQDGNKSNILSDIAAASAAEIISTANQTSNTSYKPNKESSKTVKTECELENENTLSNTVYNLLDNQSPNTMNTKIGTLILRLKNDRSVKNWNNCLSKIMLPGTEKMLEGENLTQLQESFLHAKIKTFKDLKIFVFEQCKKFDDNIETSKEYDLYDDIDGMGVDKPSTNELFPEVAILNDLDKSVSPTLGLLQASTSKTNDNNSLQVKRKSVLSHTTSTNISSGICKKNKTKVSFLKQALYNEMNQDSNDSEIRPFINGSNKIVLDTIEQIDSSPESPSNIATVDSETCMSEDSTSTISSGTPHYNFRKSKRKIIEEDGFIESHVIKRMYRGRACEDSEEKIEPNKVNNTKVQTTEQKANVESNNRRISSRLRNNHVKNNQHTPNKSPQLDNQPYKITTTTTRTSLRRVSRKTT